MGRKPTVNSNLPKGMRARKRGKQVYFYYDMGGKPRKEIALGKDYVLAVQQWSKLEMEKIPKEMLPTISTVISRYEAEIIPTKAANTQRSHNHSLKKIKEFFCQPPAPFDEIEPIHIAQYLQWRKDAPKQANLEVRIFSHIWNSAREWGYTDRANPTSGVKRHKETGRKDVYIEDYIYDLRYKFADDQMKDLMDIAYLTGQRPSDVVSIKESDIHDGVLKVVQAKTKAVVRINLIGELAEIINRRINNGGLLFKNQRGTKLTAQTLSVHFAQIRETTAQHYPELAHEILQFQFRDLRAKAGTDKALDTGNDTSAQKQLGHASLSMTMKYIRKNPNVDPTK